MTDPHEIQYIIRHSLENIGLWSRAAENLVLITGMQESGYEQLIQGYSNLGTARSFWQVEPATAIDNFKNYLDFSFNSNLKNSILEASNLIEIPRNKKDMAWLLTTNMSFAISMCRIKYLRSPDRIPNTIEGLAKMWKKDYNTSHGAGTIEECIDNAKEILSIV